LESVIQDDGQDTGRGEQLTVAEAAERLAITKEAVRKRISRGTLRSERDADGTVRVYIPKSTTASPTASGVFDRDELIAELRARIEDLRTDRDAWRDQARRSDYMASAALERTRELEDRLRELEAPRDERGSSESASEPVPDAGTPETAPEREAPTEPRPWWRRIFGGRLGEGQ
jgi:excisionase family DNA binding protein